MIVFAPANIPSSTGKNRVKTAQTAGGETCGTVEV